jgi:hypothetical protein
MILSANPPSKTSRRGMIYILALACILFLAACSAPVTPIAPIATVFIPSAIPTFPEKTGAPTQPVKTETPQPQPQPSLNPIIPTRPNNLNPMNYLPQPGDSKLKRDQAYIDTVQIIASKDTPSLATALIKGSLPTPCDQLRLQLAPDHPQNLIKIEAFSLVDPNAVCAQMIIPFEVNLPLGVLQEGKYTLAINDKTMLSFQWPLP